MTSTDPTQYQPQPPPWTATPNLPAQHQYQPPQPYQPQNNYPVAQPNPSGAASIPRKQGAWGLWWLVGLTGGIYYFIWYQRINRELATVLRMDVPSNGMWWSQLIPIYGLVGLAATANRLNNAHAAVGSPTRVSSFVAWFWAPSWFASQTRYLQRRVNILHDVIASHMVVRS